MAIARALHGFNDLGHSVTPVFLSMGHFLYRFSTFCEQMKKIYQVEVWKFLQNGPLNSVHLTCSFSWASVSNASLMVNICENDGYIWNYWCHRFTFIQNIIRIICLCWLVFDILTSRPWRSCWITHTNYQNQTSFPHAVWPTRSFQLPC